mgnify:CR=1 FL=1
MPVSGALTVVSILLGLWSFIGLAMWGMSEEWEVFVSVGPLALVYWPMQWISDWRANRERREYERVNQLNGDVMDVLQMIEWKRRELTPVQLLQEELELERVYE